jgi:VanZ family protein
MEALRELVGRLRAVPPAVGVLLAAGWVALLWHLSSKTPAEIEPGLPVGSYAWNLAHAPAYAALATWLALAARRRGTSVAPAGRTAAVIVIACLVYAIADEVHQGFVPGRDASALDVLTDLAGAASAVACLRAAADRARFARACLLALAACASSAALATFLPPLVPHLTWL